MPKEPSCSQVTHYTSAVIIHSVYLILHTFGYLLVIAVSTFLPITTLFRLAAIATKIAYPILIAFQTTTTVYLVCAAALFGVVLHHSLGREVLCLRLHLTNRLHLASTHEAYHFLFHYYSIIFLNAVFLHHC